MVAEGYEYETTDDPIAEFKGFMPVGAAGKATGQPHPGEVDAALADLLEQVG